MCNCAMYILYIVYVISNTHSHSLCFLLYRMSAAEQMRHAPHTAIPGVTPAPPPYTQAMRMNNLNALNNGAGPQVILKLPSRFHI